MIKQYARKNFSVSEKQFKKLTLQLLDLIEIGILTLNNEDDYIGVAISIIYNHHEDKFLKELDKSLSRIYFFCDKSSKYENSKFNLSLMCYYVDELENIAIDCPDFFENNKDGMKYIETKADYMTNNYLKSTQKFYVQSNLAIEKNMIVKIKIINTFTKKADYYLIDTNKNAKVVDAILGLKKGETKSIQASNNNVSVFISDVYKILNMKLDDNNVKDLEIHDVNDLASLKTLLKKMFVEAEIENALLEYKYHVYNLILIRHPFLVIPQSLLNEITHESNMTEANRKITHSNFQTILLDKLFYREFSINLTDKAIDKETSDKYRVMFFWDNFKDLSRFVVKNTIISKYVSSVLLKRVSKTLYHQIIEIIKEYKIDIKGI